VVEGGRTEGEKRRELGNSHNVSIGGYEGKKGNLSVRKDCWSLKERQSSRKAKKGVDLKRAKECDYQRKRQSGKRETTSTAGNRKKPPIAKERERVSRGLDCSRGERSRGKCNITGKSESEERKVPPRPEKKRGFAKEKDSQFTNTGLQGGGIDTDRS